MAQGQKTEKGLSLFELAYTVYIPGVHVKKLGISLYRQEKLKTWKSWHNGVATLSTTSGTVAEHVTMI